MERAVGIRSLVFAWSVVVALFAGVANAQQTATVRYVVHKDPNDLTSAVMFTATLELTEDDRVGKDVGWKIDNIFLRQDSNRTWSKADPHSSFVVGHAFRSGQSRDRRIRDFSEAHGYR